VEANDLKCAPNLDKYVNDDELQLSDDLLFCVPHFAFF
jgi:hypothetical protein